MDQGPPSTGQMMRDLIKRNSHEPPRVHWMQAIENADTDLSAICRRLYQRCYRRRMHKRTNLRIDTSDECSMNTIEQYLETRFHWHGKRIGTLWNFISTVMRLDSIWKDIRWTWMYNTRISQQLANCLINLYHQILGSVLFLIERESHLIKSCFFLN